MTPHEKSVLKCCCFRFENEDGVETVFLLAWHQTEALPTYQTLAVEKYTHTHSHTHTHTHKHNIFQSLLTTYSGWISLFLYNLSLFPPVSYLYLWTFNVHFLTLSVSQSASLVLSFLSDNNGCQSDVPAVLAIFLSWRC